jgi:hypothetical protein
MSPDPTAIFAVTFRVTPDPKMGLFQGVPPRSEGLFTHPQTTQKDRGKPPHAGISEQKPRIGCQKATEPPDFTPFPMTSPQTTISGDGKLEFEFASPDNAAFYRLQAE